MRALLEGMNNIKARKLTSDSDRSSSSSSSTSGKSNSSGGDGRRKHVVVTLGPHGLVWASSRGQRGDTRLVHLPSLPTPQAVNCTGAGE